MRLKLLKYRENVQRSGANPWELKELSLGQYNLVIGKNATGKTRIVHVINNLARMIQFPQATLNGEWFASFIDEYNHEFEFFVSWENGKIVHELIKINGTEKLERSLSSAKIYSEVSSSWQDISPPNDRLVIHVRRDKNEFPFLESLFSWASGIRGFSFANTSPNLIEIPGNLNNLFSLNAVPSALERLSVHQLEKVLKQLESIGYDIETASTGLTEGLPPSTKIVYLKEKDLVIPLKQFEISQGMFRAFSMLTIFEFLCSNDLVGSILVDDLGEGLDFERSKKLAEIIFERSTASKMQIIATSNDSFMMNVIPLEALTVCYRSKHTVQCLNWSNSKEKFESWKQLGLNNFDLLSSNFLLNN